MSKPPEKTFKIKASFGSVCNWFLKKINLMNEKKKTGVEFGFFNTY